MKNRHHEVKITSLIYAAVAHLVILISLMSVQKDYFIKISQIFEENHNIAYNTIKAETSYEAGSSEAGTSPQIPEVQNDLMTDLPVIPAPQSEPTIPPPKEIPITDDESEPSQEMKEVKEEITPPVKQRSMNLPKFKGKVKDAATDSTNKETELPGQNGVREKGRKGVGLEEAGGDQATEEAVEEGLQWLASVQDDDGKWDSDGFMNHYLPNDITDNDRYKEGAGRTYSDIGITGLCLLAFTGVGNTHESGKYSGNVALAKQFLLSEQRAEGGFGKTVGWSATMYDHSIAMLALADLYFISKDSELRKPLEKALQYLIAMRNISGGWDYTQYWNKKPEGDRGDLSISCWAIMAISSCRASGINISNDLLKELKTFLIDYTDSSTGEGIYSRKSPRAFDRGPSMVAASSFSRKLLGEKSTSNIQKKQHNKIVKEEPSEKTMNSQPGIWYLYYGSLSMFIDKSEYEEEWKKWNNSCKNVVMKYRCKDGVRKGSFDPVDPFSVHGGRLCSTAMSILCLQVYYRLTPAYIEKSKELSHLWDD